MRHVVRGAEARISRALALAVRGRRWGELAVVEGVDGRVGRRQVRAAPGHHGLVTRLLLRRGAAVRVVVWDMLQAVRPRQRMLMLMRERLGREVTRRWAGAGAERLQVMERRGWEGRVS